MGRQPSVCVFEDCAISGAMFASMSHGCGDRCADVGDDCFDLFAVGPCVAVVLEHDRDVVVEVVEHVDVGAKRRRLATDGSFDVALRCVLLPLVHLGRSRDAALLLGGLTSLSTAWPDPQRVIPRVTAALEDTLGAELDHLLKQGRSLTRQELARLALDEIDRCITVA
jgi:hypothetical protein